MFSFGRQAKAVEVHRFLRRVIDLSGPKACLHDARSEDRSPRVLPVILAAYEPGSDTLSELTRGLVKDLSSQGLGVVADQPFHAERIVAVLSVQSEPAFLLGQVRQRRSLGGGYWHLGVCLTEKVSCGEHPAMHAILPLIPHLQANAAAIAETYAECSYR